MRYSLVAFVIIILSISGSQSISGSTNCSLIPFTIVYSAGGEGKVRCEIRVYKKADKFYADNITPFFYYGRRTDGKWTVELDKAKIETCNRFLEKAKKLPKGSSFQSRSDEEYTISCSFETLYISGDYEWDGLDFYSLRKILFKEKFAELEVKKSNSLNNLNRKLKGRWYIKPMTSKPKWGDIFILTKTDIYKSGCFWDFGDNYAFKSYSKKYLNVTYSKRYHLQIDKDIVFIIERDMNKDQDSYSTIGDSETGFILESLTDKELKLMFLSQ